MKVRLVSSSSPSLDIQSSVDLKTCLDLVAFCARVSNPSNQNNTQSTDKLIAYLLKHKHFSPFEMVNVVLEVETTRDIARQLLRHRSFTFQEFSQRYADPTKDLQFEVRQARLQDQKNRQNSISLDLTDPDARELNDMWIEKQQDIIRMVRQTYQWALSNGIAKEQARSVLPEGLTMSRLYVNGTLRSWLHYIDLRTGEETQLEHRQLAAACAEAIVDTFSLIKQYNHYS